MKRAKIAGSIVCLMLAGVIFWWTNRPSTAMTEAPETSTNWMCAKCGAIVPLTLAEAMRAEQKAGGLPLICPQCDKKELYRAAQCATCGTFYFSSDVPGSLGRCPVCFPPDSGNYRPPPPTVDEKGEPLPPSV